jgi:ABC-type uncharacterized transport system YnjBCD ATPase subunit
MSRDPAGTGVSVLPSPAIEARALTLRMGGATLLEAADFTVRRGEIALLCAPSGAGKTVLLKLLAGVMRPGTGAFTADGALRYETTDLLADAPPPGRVGILFQHHALFDELSPKENVLFARRHPLVAGRGEARGTMPIATAVVREARLRARLAAITMPAQRRRAALDQRSEHAPMVAGEPRSVRLQKLIAVSAHDVGHLPGWPTHGLRKRRDRAAVSGAETGIASSGLVTACRCRCDRWR